MRLLCVRFVPECGCHLPLMFFHLPRFRLIVEVSHPPLPPSTSTPPHGAEYIDCRRVDAAPSLSLQMGENFLSAFPVFAFDNSRTFFAPAHSPFSCPVCQPGSFSFVTFFGEIPYVFLFVLQGGKRCADRPPFLAIATNFPAEKDCPFRICGIFSCIGS